MKQSALFIDRDGTLSEEVGYVNHPSRFRLFPYSAAALKLGVARGYFSEDIILDVHDRLTKTLEREDSRLDAIYYCAHHPSVGDPPYRQECDCRKPQAGLIRRASTDFDIDLTSSWMVGDRYSDIELARNAGVGAAFVMSGYGRGEWEYQRGTWTHQPDLVCENLFQAVKSILDLNQKNELHDHSSISSEASS